ncbi:MAG TPA: hypothetical protein VMY06_03020 [Sedimentisphaerales bacterium]|nr:hypothetical protein [Sedimentisphaerales bacterium]
MLWLKPNCRGLIIFASPAVILSFLCLLYGRILNGDAGAGYGYNWGFISLFAVIMILCWPISMYSGRIIKSEKAPAQLAFAVRFFVFAPALTGLVFFAFIPLYLFYIIFAIVISVPMIVLLMVSLWRSHPVLFAAVALIIAGLVFAASLQIYVARPLMLIVYVIVALVLSMPVFTLINTPFKRTAMILYMLFLCALLVVYSVPLTRYHRFYRQLARVRPGRYLDPSDPGPIVITKRRGPGMTFAQVEQIMQAYPMTTGKKWYPPLTGPSEDSTPNDKPGREDVSARRELDVVDGCVYYGTRIVGDADGCGMEFRKGHVVRIWHLD